jgi:hypothetical protein
VGEILDGGEGKLLEVKKSRTNNEGGNVEFAERSKKPVSHNAL